MSFQAYPLIPKTPMIRTSILFCLAFFFSTTTVFPAEILSLNKENWKGNAPFGKEADAIYGDFVLKNDLITLVVAQAKPGRKANMTVRDVSGAIIDLTFTTGNNDQLSCFYPLNRYFDFSREAPEQSAIEIDGTSYRGLTFTSAISKHNTQATLTYLIADGNPYVEVKTSIKNIDETKTATVMFQDSIRADRLFTFGLENKKLFWANDQWFRQAYGIQADTAEIEQMGRSKTILDYILDGKKSISLTPGETTSLTRKVFPGRSLLHLKSVSNRLNKIRQQPVKVVVQDANGPIAHAKVTASQGDKTLGDSRTSGKGIVHFGLPDGQYNVRVEALGRPVKNIDVAIKKEPGKADSKELTFELEQCGYVAANIAGANGAGIPCKVGFYGIEGTADPDFAPSSAVVAVGNLHYSHNGKFTQAVGPGKYELLISYGPEYDAVTKTIEVKRGETTKVSATLERTVDTPGWISAEYHSHSTPSGDNVSDQRGRVLNLLCENLEFCPCTEHNRISSYVPHLKFFGVESLMSTCSGMELTGSPLPVNHQNAFPLHRHIHHQDGGGPQTDSNPVVQIERLAMWDDNSDKLVQGNHPNIRQIYGDRDNDKTPDGGFRQMFSFMDVIEVHPQEYIFDSPAEAAKRGNRGNTIFQWMQLLNQGYRIAGVVNTDAHYNFHGSGALRNYIKSSTDDPAKIKVLEMVHASEKAHVIMTNGPYLEVQLESGKAKATAGDDIQLEDGKGKLLVKVQCSNWLDVNRVQILLNGKMSDKLNFTRRDNPKLFSNGIMKFEATIELELEEDTHLIVATIGEGMSLGRVMGPSFGKRPPCAVSNPIFIDIDGNGFQHNHDDLGIPLPD